jgi:hypothetical protein
VQDKKGGETGAEEGEDSDANEEGKKQNAPKDGQEDEGRRCWPRWMADGFTLLSGCPHEGREWKAAVETWTRLEKAYGFKTSQRSSIRRDRRWSSICGINT